MNVLNIKLYKDLTTQIQYFLFFFAQLPND